MNKLLFKDKKLIDNMVLVDAFSNMSMSLVFLLSFPKRVFHDEYICLVIGVIRTFVLVINRLKKYFRNKSRYLHILLI